MKPSRQAAAVLLSNCGCWQVVPAIPASRGVGLPTGCPTNRIPAFASVGVSCTSQLGNGSLHSLHLRGQWRLEKKREERGKPDTKFMVNCLAQRIGLNPFHSALGVWTTSNFNRRSLNVSCRTERNPEEEILDYYFSFSCWEMLARSLQCPRVIPLEDVMPYCRGRPHILKLSSLGYAEGLQH